MRVILIVLFVFLLLLASCTYDVELTDVKINHDVEAGLANSDGISFTANNPSLKNLDCNLSISFEEKSIIKAFFIEKKHKKNLTVDVNFPNGIYDVSLETTCTPRK